jgi:hypothetical protein
MAKTFKEARRLHDRRVKKRMKKGLPCDTNTYDNILSKYWPDFVKKNFKKCEEIVHLMGSQIEGYMSMGLSLDNGLWNILISFAESDLIIICFLINVDPAVSANIAMQMLAICAQKEIRILIGPSYGFETDSEGNFVDIAWTDDELNRIGIKSVQVGSSDKPTRH